MMRGSFVIVTTALILNSNADTGREVSQVGAQSPPVLNTPDENLKPRPILCRGTFEVEATRNRLQEVLQSSDSDARDAEQLRQAYPDATTFQQWELPACQLLAARRITDEQYGQFIEKIVPRLLSTQSDNLRTPEVQEPKKDAVFDHYPRRTRVSWKAVANATKYILEVQAQTFELRHDQAGASYLVPKGWIAHNDGLHDAEVSGTNAEFYFIGAGPGRLRVRAVGEAGETGKPSSWRYFRFTR